MNRHSTRQHLARAALFALTRGAATALGGTIITLLGWWITQR